MSGGWAGWIKSDRGLLQVDGPLKAKLLDTSIAEAMAALNCICYAIGKDMIREGDVVVLATDNNNVMDVLTGKARRKFRRKDARKRGWTTKQLRQYLKQSNEHIDKISTIFEHRMVRTGFDLRWNHVKGHRGKIDRRAAVNHGCDERARSAMQSERKANRRKKAGPPFGDPA